MLMFVYLLVRQIRARVVGVMNRSPPANNATVIHSASSTTTAASTSTKNVLSVRSTSTIHV